jgi:hypothetical protein
MLRLTEIGLFLVPFALFVVWRLTGPRTPPGAVWAAGIAVLALAGIMIWFGLHRRMEAGETYEPARLEGGQVIPGHGVAKTR